MNVQNVAIGTVTGVLNAFSKSIAEKKIEFAKSLGFINEEEGEYLKSLSEPIDITLVNISSFLKELRYIDFIVPDLISTTIMWSGIIGVASSLVEDRVTGIRQRILSTPTSLHLFAFLEI